MNRAFFFHTALIVRVGYIPVLAIYQAPVDGTTLLKGYVSFFFYLLSILLRYYSVVLLVWYIT